MCKHCERLEKWVKAEVRCKAGHLVGPKISGQAHQDRINAMMSSGATLADALYATGKAKEK